MRIGVWVGGIVAMTVSSAAGVEGIYPTTADLRRAALVVEGNAAAIAFNGPVQGLETLGGRIAFETGSFTLLLAGLMSVFMLSRQTRAEEESGRLELIRATIVGRHAPMVAALLVVAAMNVAVGAALTLGFIGLGLPPTGCVAYGVSVTAIGLAFAGITALTAQIAENTRAASGLGGLGVGVAYTLRAVGDIGDGTLSWLSPIGWGQKMRPFSGHQWWPLMLPVLFFAACLWLSATLASHRDSAPGSSTHDEDRPRRDRACVARWVWQHGSSAARSSRGAQGSSCSASSTGGLPTTSKTSSRTSTSQSASSSPGAGATSSTRSSGPHCSSSPSWAAASRSNRPSVSAARRMRYTQNRSWPRRCRASGGR
jgi:putative exporter of polyketide antibiotics